RHGATTGFTGPPSDRHPAYAPLPARRSVRSLFGVQPSGITQVTRRTKLARPVHCDSVPMVALHTTFPVTGTSSERRVEVRPRRVAVVLNANARRVDAETVRWVRSVVPERDLFLSQRLEECPRIARDIVRSGFDAVLWGGGDGTFANGVAEVVAAARAQGRRLPEMGCLRLGTGNAIADAIGASRATPAGLADDLIRARGASSARQLLMLDIEGRPGLFCGFGLDAQILDDYGATVRALERLHIADAVKSAGVRYFLAVAGRSIPRFLTAQRAEIVVIN